MDGDRNDVVREDVRVDDPELTPEANRLLTGELREALGTEQVELPAEDAADAHRVPRQDRRTLGSLIGANRLLVAIAFVALLVIGAIIALATGSWWAVVGAAAVHALGTVIVAGVVLRLSSAVEHADPSTAARLRDEGVGDPDQVLSDMVDQYSGRAGGAAEIVSSGNNRVTVRPDEDPLRAAAEQRTAGTPAATPTAPAGERGLPRLWPLLAVGASVVVAVAVGIAEGGIAWIGSLLLVGSGLGWWLLERLYAGQEAERRDADAGGRRRAAGDTAAARRGRLLPIAAIVVAYVAAGVIIVGALAGYL